MSVYDALPSLSTAVRVNPWVSEKFIVAARVKGKLHKLFAIHFIAKDGSVFVDLPYFPLTEGLLSVVDQEVGPMPTEIDLKQQGHLVSHMVKYSHHPSGRVHFSKDGKILTVVKREATPLNKVQGHMFTVYANGLSNFEEATQKEKQEELSKRSWLEMPFGNTDPGWIKVVGYWNTRYEFLRRYKPLAENRMLGPRLDRGHGANRFLRVVIAPRVGNPSHDSVMLIEAVVLSPDAFKVERGPSVLLVGGFDEQEKVRASPNLCFIAALYPATKFEDLRQFLPLIDYHRAENPDR